MMPYDAWIARNNFVKYCVLCTCWISHHKRSSRMPTKTKIQFPDRPVFASQYINGFSHQTHGFSSQHTHGLISHYTHGFSSQYRPGFAIQPLNGFSQQTNGFSFKPTDGFLSQCTNGFSSQYAVCRHMELVPSIQMELVPSMHRDSVLSVYWIELQRLLPQNQ